MALQVDLHLSNKRRLFAVCPSLYEAVLEVGCFIETIDRESEAWDGGALVLPGAGEPLFWEFEAWTFGVHTEARHLCVLTWRMPGGRDGRQERRLEADSGCG